MLIHLDKEITKLLKKRSELVDRINRLDKDSDERKFLTRQLVSLSEKINQLLENK